MVEEGRGGTGYATTVFKGLSTTVVLCHQSTDALFIPKLDRYQTVHKLLNCDTNATINLLCGVP